MLNICMVAVTIATTSGPGETGYIPIGANTRVLPISTEEKRHRPVARAEIYVGAAVTYVVQKPVEVLSQPCFAPPRDTDDLPPTAPKKTK